MFALHKQCAFYSFLIILASNAVCAKSGYGFGEQDWGYFDIRTGAHIFYWLYYTTDTTVSNYTERPLIVWLQGGPGMSSTGYGNFFEVGTLNYFKEKRNESWAQYVNMLYIDSPVGSGFSYVDDETYYAMNDTQIALDLVKFMQKFYSTHEEFVNVPLHIFGESYGGRTAPEFALELKRALERKEVEANLISVNIISGWVAPLDTILAGPPLLRQMGIIDELDNALISEAIIKLENLIEQHKWSNAWRVYAELVSTILCLSKGIDFYNILKYEETNSFTQCYIQNGAPNVDDSAFSRPKSENIIKRLMREEVGPALNITKPERFKLASSDVYAYLIDDFLLSSLHIVNEVLNKKTIQVNVWAGQLDLICAAAGANKWVERLNWYGKSDYMNAKREAIVLDGIVEGYRKGAHNFNMYLVNRAGHVIPADNPKAALHLLKDLINYS